MYDPRDCPRPFTVKDPVGSSGRSPFVRAQAIRKGWDYLSPAGVLNARAHYYGQITFQDQQVGKVIDALERRDQLDSTIIIYASDHGDMLGDFGFFAKSCFYRGSVNVPFIIRYPEKVRAGLVTDTLMGLQDVFPTLVGLTGVATPGPMDGMDLSPHLAGEAFTEREFIISYYGDDPFQSYMIATKEWKYVYNQAAGGLEEFYDLRSDPQEEHNLAGTAEVRDEVGTMRGEMIRWIREHGDRQMLDEDGDLKANPEDPAATMTFEDTSMGWRWF
jgi:arylsulfatase A-like enzyme